MQIVLIIQLMVQDLLSIQLINNMENNQIMAQTNMTLRLFQLQLMNKKDNSIH